MTFFREKGFVLVSNSGGGGLFFDDLVVRIHVIIDMIVVDRP